MYSLRLRSRYGMLDGELPLWVCGWDSPLPAAPEAVWRLVYLVVRWCVKARGLGAAGEGASTTTGVPPENLRHAVRLAAMLGAAFPLAMVEARLYDVARTLLWHTDGAVGLLTRTEPSSHADIAGAARRVAEVAMLLHGDRGCRVDLVRSRGLNRPFRMNEPSDASDPSSHSRDLPEAMGP